MNRPAEDRNNDLTGCWERFWHSGRVEDYLAYRAAQAAAPRSRPMQTVTNALVLRERKLDEQDRLLTLLSADRGIITAYAKGAGRMKGSMAGATELLCYSHFVLFQNRERCFADKAEANTLFFGIRGNLEKLTLATYFAQLCCELIPENEPAAEELRLMLNTLYCLERDKLPPLQLKAILELRLLTLTGYMPDLIACRACGGLPEDGVVLFDPSGGSICCPGCAPSGAVGLLPLPPGVFAAMRHIIYCDFEKLFQFKLGEENLPVLAHAVEQYLLCQVERILPALNFYKTICI